MQDRRAKVDLVERVFGVLAGLTAAAEERLEGLRGELDHALALDPCRPTALEVAVLRAEHAELHGSVCTTTSATVTAARIRSSIWLARACASARDDDASSASAT